EVRHARVYRTLGAKPVELGIRRRWSERHGLVEVLEEGPGLCFVFGDPVHALPLVCDGTSCDSADFTAFAISATTRATSAGASSGARWPVSASTSNLAPISC